MIGITDGRVINILADGADPTFHNSFSFDLVVIPTNALHGTTVNCTLNISFRCARGIVTFGFAGAVEAKDTRTSGYAKPAADTAILIYTRFFHEIPPEQLQEMYTSTACLSTKEHFKGVNRCFLKIL